MLPNSFDWWYENVNDFLTENEARHMSQEVFDEINIFLDKKEYRNRSIIYLRGKCRALSFPVLFHKFDRLLKRRLEDNYIDEWTIITEISQRTKNLENNFPEEQSA